MDIVHGEVLVPLNTSSSTIMVTAKRIHMNIREEGTNDRGSAACLLLGRVVTSLLSS